MYDFQSENMNVISRLSNTGIREVLRQFVSKKVVSDIFESHIRLKFRVLFSYLTFFFKKEYLKHLIKETFQFSDLLVNFNEEKLLIENIESEEHTGLLKLNMMLLFSKFDSRKSRKLLSRFTDHEDRVISIIARGAAAREKTEDIQYLMDGHSGSTDGFYPGC